MTKVKAVIMRPDRYNSVVRLKKKQIREKQFLWGDYVYTIDPDRFQLTFDRRNFGFLAVYVTFYYKMGVSKPLPVPNFPVGQNGDFAGVVDNGVSPGELAGIFNPYFLRTVAPHKKDMLEQLQFYFTAANLAVGVYVIWLLTNVQKALG